jgi:hypothetical protein
VTINGVVQEPKNEFSSGVLVYVPSIALCMGKNNNRNPSVADWTLVGARNRSKARSSHAPPRPRALSGRSTFRITRMYKTPC